MMYYHLPHYPQMRHASTLTNENRKLTGETRQRPGRLQINSDTIASERRKDLPRSVTAFLH